MQKLTRTILNTIAIALFLSSGLAQANFKSDIIASCKSYQLGSDKSEVNACKLYIDGYIDSSLQMEDAGVKISDQDKEQLKENEYVQRAYRTRTFGRSSINLDYVKHSFCIPNDFDRQYIASEVAKSMDIKRIENVDLKQVLFDTLVTRFPCEANNLAQR